MGITMLKVHVLQPPLPWLSNHDHLLAEPTASSLAMGVYLVYVQGILEVPGT